MIKLILPLIFVLAGQYISAQNWIDYKVKANTAFEELIDNNQPRKALKILQELENSYDLKGEELILRAKCYSEIKRYRKSSIALKNAWSTHFTYFSFFASPKGFSLNSISKNYNARQKERVNEGFKVSAKLEEEANKRIQFIIDSCDITDQVDRNNYYSQLRENSNDTIILSKLKTRMDKTDSSNFMCLVKIIKDFGYPGDKICPHKGQISNRILLHMSDTIIIEKYHDLFYEEVIKGNLSPYVFGRWMDTYNTSKGKSAPYGLFPYPAPENNDSFNAEQRKRDIIENRKKIGASKYYPIYL